MKSSRISIFGFRISPARGFTLVELLVCIAIFVMMTALLIANYSNFNESTFLTNTAYDVALAIRQTQTYGVSVRSASGSDFSQIYGVDFVMNANNFDIMTGPANSGTVPLSNIYSQYNIMHGATIYKICATNTDALDCSNSANIISHVQIWFHRPDPEPIILGSGYETYTLPDGSFGILYSDNITGTTYKFTRITLRGVDGSTRNVDIYANGQVSVVN
jgi:prepilin-type N-terminal cleavage/methylation domain-containing protein